MTSRQNALSVALIATLSTSLLLVGTPAHASGAYTYGDPIEVGGTTWTLNTSGTWLAGSTGSYSNPFQYTDLYVGPGQVTCPSPTLMAPDENGDVELNCYAVETFNEVMAQSTWRFYGDGDLVRQLVTVRNFSTNEVPVNWSLSFKFGSAPLQATSSQPTLANTFDRPLGLSDVWQYNDSGSSILNAALAWGSPDSPQPHTYAQSAFIDQVAYDPIPPVMVAPEQVVSFAFYYKIDPTYSDSAPDEVDVAGVTEEFANFTGRLVRGLPAGTTVQNWGTVPADEVLPTPPGDSPELAETGAPDVALVNALGLATALLAAGTVVVVRRQRAAVRASA